MQVLSRLPLLGLLLCASPAGAQPTTSAGAPVGPLRCYLSATRGRGLPMVQAKQLCMGAVDESPARCFAQASDEFTDAQAVRLCAGATSLAPSTCAVQLDDTTNLDDGAIVAYCAALRWPLVPVPEAGAPECVARARDRTMLSDHDTVQLCSGAISALPVDCYAWGQSNTLLADRDLIDLCRSLASVPYVPVPQ